jgi:hypothetical protein
VNFFSGLEFIVFFIFWGKELLNSSYHKIGGKTTPLCSGRFPVHLQVFHIIPMHPRAGLQRS